ncbi:putative disease resistance protein RGA4 [Gossypium raimondii]|uniref:putative disease resistance protein RGA4 n=1 Tax=Gossypium raimondii TaxID=29730 RepID=UPI00227CA41C|nr:putative disease resistance protein RGA4 [Gossypium raimondii]
MAQSFAFGITGKVLEKLGNVAYEGICSAWGVRKEFEKLKDTLAAIRAVVLDAEQQQARTQELSLWIQRFKDACYDVEDSIDQFEIEALRRQVLEWEVPERRDMNKEELHKVLQDCLNGKRFLMVLDDVWKDKKKRSELKDLLCGGAQGSIIIVTTRSRKVATITGTVSPYDLEHLSYENCMSLFLKLAFKEGEEKQHVNLVRIGAGIVKKCEGVALAVKTLGSLLCSTRVQHDWELVRDSELWKLRQEENDILPALKLCYDQLPWYLKQCFAFCSVFPKAFQFNDHFLISVWKANGFLQSPYENEEPEDIGNRYIQELLSRSFFQQVEEELCNSVFKMHDLVHDLALSVAQNEVNSCNHYSTGNVRHLWFDLSKQDASQLPNNLSRLQSLFLLDREGKADSESLIAEVISRSKHLRVLDLGDWSFEHFPNNICYLKQLRFSNLSSNGNIRRLPNFICNLQSLQTLHLGGCWGIEELPKDIRYLISLRELMVTTKQTRLQENGISYLTSLRLLGFCSCENLEKLFEGIQNLTALRILCIEDCKNLVSSPQGLKYLTTLEV